MKTNALFLTVAFCASALPLQAQDWDGWHAGLQLGGARAEGSHDITLDGFSFGLEEPTGLEEIDGGFIGIRGGRDWVSGPIVYGFEADISKTDIEGFFSNAPSGSANDYFETKVDGLGSIRGRVGYLVGSEQNTLLYGLAGVAGADVYASNGDAARVDGEIVADCNFGCAKASDTVFGGIVGVGVEHQLRNIQVGAGNLSVGLEYAYYDFGDVAFKTTTTDITPEDHEFDVDLSAHTLQAVIRMRF